MGSAIKFDISKNHPCMVNGCPDDAESYQEYCVRHLEMVIHK